MPDFSNSDIAEAKRRVEEMRRRATFPDDEDRKDTVSPSPDRAENVLQISRALDSLLTNDRRDVLLAVLLHLASQKEEDMLLLTLLGILLQ